MSPDDYNLYHIFERGLLKADSNTICEDLGYPKYTDTVTHGFWKIKMTLDLYDHADEASLVDHAAFVKSDTCADETEECFYSSVDETLVECCTPGEMCIPNVGCRC